MGPSKHNVPARYMSGYRISGPSLVISALPNTMFRLDIYALNRVSGPSLVICALSSTMSKVDI